MGSSLGNISAGPQWSDVGHSGIDGPTLSITLAEEVNSSAEWECRVLARTTHGTFHMGSFRTRSPARGDVPSRLVAICYFPGAISWLTSWRKIGGGNALSQADVTLSSSEYCGGTLPGITPITSGAAPNGLRSFSFVPAFGAVPVRLLAPGSLLLSAVGNLNDPAGGPAFVMLFDQVLAPVLGDTPFWSHSLGAIFIADTSDWNYPIAGLAQGRPVEFGLWAALSSTSPIFTPIAAAQTANATVEASLP